MNVKDFLGNYDQTSTGQSWLDTNITL